MLGKSTVIRLSCCFIISNNKYAEKFFTRKVAEQDLSKSADHDLLLTESLTGELSSPRFSLYRAPFFSLLKPKSCL